MGRLDHKPGRKSNYLKSLDNPYYREVKSKALIRDGFECVDCGSRLRLELHHTKYWVSGVNIVGKELEYMDYVVTLCETCHQERHNLNK